MLEEDVEQAFCSIEDARALVHVFWLRFSRFGFGFRGDYSFSTMEALVLVSRLRFSRLAEVLFCFFIVVVVVGSDYACDGKFNLSL